MEKSNSFSNSKLKVFHFCTKTFYNDLISKEIIIADCRDIYKEEPAYYVKNYVFKVRKLNNGNGMFFAWTRPDYKGKIEYSEDGDFILLELLVDEEIVVKTSYENWCSCGMDIFDCEGDLKKTDLYCKEVLGMQNGLEDSYKAIFDLSDPIGEIQVLLPYIKSEWIKNKWTCVNKHI